MAFKLGTERQNYAVSGEIKSKLRFHREGGDPDASVPGNPVIRKDLEPGINGEANMDGSIFISDIIEPGSAQERNTLMHEMVHATDMKTGKLAYCDDFVEWNGVKYLRKEIDGKDMILDVEDSKWKEAGGNFPWERKANMIA